MPSRTRGPRSQWTSKHPLHPTWEERVEEARQHVVTSSHTPIIASFCLDLSALMLKLKNLLTSKTGSFPTTVLPLAKP